MPRLGRAVYSSSVCSRTQTYIGTWISVPQVNWRCWPCSCRDTWPSILHLSFFRRDYPYRRSYFGPLPTQDGVLQQHACISVCVRVFMHVAHMYVYMYTNVWRSFVRSQHAFVLACSSVPVCASYVYTHAHIYTHIRTNASTHVMFACVYLHTCIYIKNTHRHVHKRKREDVRTRNVHTKYTHIDTA